LIRSSGESKIGTLNKECQLFFQQIIVRVKQFFSEVDRRKTASALRKIAEYEKQNSARLQSLAAIKDDYNFTYYNVQMAFVKMISTQIQRYEIHRQCSPGAFAEEMIQQMSSDLEQHEKDAKSTFDKLSPQYQERVILEKLSED
jgi:L-lysine 2,3-aminomutase